ncbi:MAG: hypothetical protein EXR75_09340 [Myxococcales bacterium]|nr:hypothetical protein [Myxococcales bacterium]
MTPRASFQPSIHRAACTQRAAGLGLAVALWACGGTAETTDAASGAGGGGGAGTGGSTANSTATGGPATPEPAYQPAVTGNCPALANGYVEFAPAGIPPRQVRLSLDVAALGKGGPLVFYWHGAGSKPEEAEFGLSPTTVAEITSAGGIVAAPVHDPNAGQFPWFLTTGSGPENDLVLADEILACATRDAGIDVRRVHSIGMSAGGLQTTQMSYRRSGYLASVVTYSGGVLGTPSLQEDNNKFPAMIFHGGASDQVIVGFQKLSEKYRDDLVAKGHFAFICDHGNGHKIPTDARTSVWQFFTDHPFGTSPSPYKSGLPATFPSYCAL